KRFRYLTIGTLFVNISIGGTLTNFAAPPVLMVSERWGWSSAFMFTHFGWRAALAVAINTLMIVVLFFKELRQLDDRHTVEADHPTEMHVPWWMVVIHLGFIGAVVFYSHH